MSCAYSVGQEPETKSPNLSQPLGHVAVADADAAAAAVAAVVGCRIINRS